MHLRPPRTAQRPFRVHPKSPARKGWLTSLQFLRAPAKRPCCPRPGLQTNLPLPKKLLLHPPSATTAENRQGTLRPLTLAPQLQGSFQERRPRRTSLKGRRGGSKFQAQDRERTLFRVVDYQSSNFSDGGNNS
jgi:hypothetical protein